jgi:transposase-like protein
VWDGTLTYLFGVLSQTKHERTAKPLNDSKKQDFAERLLGFEVERFRDRASKLAIWMEENIPESFAVFMLSPHQRSRLRSTSMIEGVKKETERRSRVATLIPDETSWLRLVGAILMEITEEWEAGKKSLTLETIGSTDKSTDKKLLCL